MVDYSSCSNQVDNLIYVAKCNLGKVKIELMLGEQGWRSGESTRLPPMGAGFDFEHGPYVG